VNHTAEVAPVPVRAPGEIDPVELRRDQWNHTASVMALIANVNRDPKRSKLLKPADFHPHVTAKTQRDTPPKADITLLKTVFVDRLHGK